MNLTETLAGWTVPKPSAETHIRKYSTTADILSFKRCRRQYGYFGVRGFASATNTQRYFGTLVHDVLDRINREYREAPSLPDHARIVELVQEAHERLVRSGVRPYNSRQQQEQAVKLVERFVLLIGPHFFPHVRQTEYRLERALRTPERRDYILTGIVDVLSGSVSHELGLPFSTMPDDIEIWDYKSGKMPEKGSRELEDYQYQMWVYAELYRQQTGDYPARSVLVFLGELGRDADWAAARSNAARARGLIMKAIYPIYPTPKHVERAIADFNRTVEHIESERARPYGDQWRAPGPAYVVDVATCEACELRYNCDYFRHSEPARARREYAEPL